MRALVVVSSENAASQNIKENLLGLEKFRQAGAGFWSAAAFDMAEYPGSIVEIVPTHRAGYYVFASTHRSASRTPGFSVHTPGNWGDADLGGKPRTLNFSMPSKIKLIARKMKELSVASLGWQVSVEVDHHGPTLDAPVLFAEIGSTEAEWSDRNAGEIAAKAMLHAMKSEELFPSCVGFGGSHYSPKFTPIILGRETALGHIISGYSLERFGADAEMVGQAMAKNAEKIDSALLDWKGIKGKTRDALIAALDSLGVKWEKA
ncbi:D-aminoacyl-tRNA deacylase [uncultured archaeon]|nr:D-aminoacyl-tRNA deacylase [uncultured archaeon]